MRWVLSFKRGGPVGREIIEARDEETAGRVGQRWCEQENARFIGVKKEVVADERILEVEKAMGAAAPLPPADFGRK